MVRPSRDTLSPRAIGPRSRITVVDRPVAKSKNCDGAPIAVVEGGVVRQLVAIDPGVAADLARAVKARPVPALAVH